MSKAASALVMQCQTIKKTFHDGGRTLEILRGLDLDVYEGEILAISGASGAGKSTLLHIMGTLDRPSAGEVLYRGQTLARMGQTAVNRLRNEDIGFVFQFYHLLPEFTALENTMMPALCRGKRLVDCQERATELLRRVGLEDRMRHKPGMLSGGEQQRAAIARALYNRPGILLADEPTGNLDERTGRGIIDLLLELNEAEGITMVIVSHDDALAHRAHRWVHLHEGRAMNKT